MPRRRQPISASTNVRRATSMIAATRNRMNENEGCPGRYEMFVSSTMPPGISATHGFRQRTTAHVVTNPTRNTMDTSSTTNGSGSVEMPSPTAARPHSRRRIRNSAQRAPAPASVGSISRIVWSTRPVTVAAPTARPTG
jgi:hypothetical protein